MDNLGVKCIKSEIKSPVIDMILALLNYYIAGGISVGRAERAQHRPELVEKRHFEVENGNLFVKLN